MRPGLRVDLVHTSPVVLSALRRELHHGEHLDVTTTVHSWSAFQEEWDFAGDFVVLDARIDPAPAPTAELTDRELQVCSLYAAMRGHSPHHLGRVLRLRTATIRSHLERGRARYRAAGLPTHNRAALREALIVDGWFLDPRIWLDAGRP